MDTVAMNVTATPIGAPVGNAGPQDQPKPQQDLRQTMQDVAQAVSDAISQFDDEPSEQEVDKAKGFLGSFMDYIKGAGFKQDVMSASKKYNVPPKKIANGFFSSCLGTIGDILGIGISTVGNVGHTLIDLLSSVAHGAVNLLVKVANGLASMVTFNHTCVCA